MRSAGFLKPYHLPCEVLVVVDSAEDATVPWVEKYAEEDDRVRIVLNNYGSGPGACYQGWL